VPHNYETIGGKVKEMLGKWDIPIEKCHVFLRDEGGNMRKVVSALIRCRSLKSISLLRLSRQKDFSMQTAGRTSSTWLSIRLFSRKQQFQRSSLVVVHWLDTSSIADWPRED
jgi:hypothetical protein